MTLTLELPRELEDELQDEAERRGLSLEEYALHVLMAGLTIESLPTTGADLVRYWREEGLIGSRLDIENSETFARSLRHQAETRSWE
jgi:hypothetical protein